MRRPSRAAFAAVAARASHPATALCGYVLLAVAVFWSTWEAPTHRWIGPDGDAEIFIWHLRWLPHALSHGLGPLLSDHLNYPDGFNLMWNASIIFPALALAPVTVLMGPVVAYDVLVTLSLALSAWCAFLAFRRYVRRDLAAGIGGLLYGFSPFMLGHAGAHVHITFALYPPLVLLLLDDTIVRQRGSAVRRGALLGTATALQLLTGEEVLAQTALVAAVGVVLLGLLNRRAVRARLPFAAHAFAVATVVAASIGTYPLAVQFLGSQRVAGSIQTQGVYVVDTIEPLVPTGRQLMTLDAANRLSAHFSGQTEAGAYVGLPLLLLVVFVAVRHRSVPIVRFTVLLAGLVLVMSLGPRPRLAGDTLPVRLPWVVPQRLPLLQNILPARLALLLFLLLALLVAIFCDHVPRSPTRRLLSGAAAVVAALAPLLPSLPYPSSDASSPQFFENVAGLVRIPRGSVALVAPLASASSGNSRAMLWQATSTFRFRMPEGYLVVPGPSLDPASIDSTLFRRLLAIQDGRPAAPPSHAADAAVACDLARLHVRTVLVGPMRTGGSEMTAFFTRLFARDPLRTGGVALWRVPGRFPSCLR